MNRRVLDRTAAAARVCAARLRRAVAFVLLAFAFVAAPASALADAWAPASSLNTARYGHTATLLSSGKVLVAGGSGPSGSFSSAELYDLATNTWTATGNMATARVYHTATLLPSGKVLVTGGRNGGSIYASAELYDPVTNTWSPAGNMAASRYGQAATLLPSGKVLVTGGSNGGVLANADLYDPATNAWSAVGPMGTARYLHTATLLPSGQVLVAGGRNGGGSTANAELYDPATGVWSTAGTLVTARHLHTATLLPSGQVLAAGGQINGTILASAELYDPATNAWSTTGALAEARGDNQRATLLPSGKVLVTGGGGAEDILGSAELYDPATGTWSLAGYRAARLSHTATLLPSGQVLIAGGYDGGILNGAERYDPAAGAMAAAGNLTTARYFHTATPLPSGQLLLAGGYGLGFLASAERYDPATNTWSAAASMTTARMAHTATLLPSGQVLVVAGTNSNTLASAERYDPATNTWRAAGTLAKKRDLHTATLLPSGKVLVVGGYNSGTFLADAELYDPATNAWSTVASLATARYVHTATLLPSGKVLVVGGTGNGNSILASAELYDPVAGTWSSAGSLSTARSAHTATLLPSGKVLVAGGSNAVGAELYDPSTNTWSAAGNLATARSYHTATLLPSGKVLVTGGNNAGGNIALAELYDPAANAWTATASLGAARQKHVAALLPSGQVVISGGTTSGSDSIGSAERYDPGLAPVAALQPNVSAVNTFLLQTSPLAATSPGSATAANAATATGFMPLREGGDGAFGQSASNAPVFQVQRIDNGQMRFVPNDGSIDMTDTTFTGSASALAGFPAGPVQVRVWVNGVPSASRPSTLAVKPGRPAAPTASGGVAQVTVSFAEVTETGGAPVTSYTATASPGGATASCMAPCASIVVSSLPVGSYTFTVHATNAAGNGPESPPSNSAAVTLATPSLAWSAPAAIVYGTPLGVAQLNATATYGGDTVAGTFAYAPPAGSVLPAGAGQLSVTFTPSDTAHYTSATASVPIDVTRAPLTVNGTSVQDKPYDGTTTATLSGGALVGVIAADAGHVTLTQAGTFAQADVGTALAVTANDAIGGSAAGNYALTQPTGLAADITPATLTYTATPLTIPYGTTPGGLGGSVTGFVPGESQATATTGTPAFSTTATATSAVGHYPIIGSGLAANRGNYDFAQDAGNATALTIVAAAPATMLSAPATAVYGEAVIFVAKLSLPAGNTGTIAGSVAFTEGGQPLPGGCATAATVNGGIAACTTQALAASATAHHVVATFTPSDGNTTVSTGSAEVTIGKAATTTTITNAQPWTIQFGVPTTVSVAVVADAPSSTTPSGTVTVSDGDAENGDHCTITLPATGCTLTPSSAGTKTLSATYTPDAAAGANLDGSSASATLTVERAEQAALNLVATPDVLIPGMTSQLATSGGSGSGAVSYVVDSGPCSVSGDVAAATAVGTCLVRVHKAGDANYDAASATATISVQVAVAPTAQAQSASVAFNTARTIQLVGSDDNPGGPHALTYAIVDAPSHGTLDHFDASTGALTYLPERDYVGVDRFTFTVSSTNGVSQPAEVTLDVSAPQLALLAGDGRDHARYGQIVDYVVTLTNAGDTANAVPVTFTLSEGFDRTDLRISCFGATDGANCDQDATDPLRFTVTLPPNRSLTWLVSVRVRSDAADDAVTFGVAAIGTDGVTDTNTLVVFRDGFDVRNGDGTQAVPLIDGEAARSVLTVEYDENGEPVPVAMVPIRVPQDLEASPFAVTWLIVRDAGRELRVEGRVVAGTRLVRLLVRDADGRERATAWSRVEPGAVLMLGGVADGDGQRVLLLDGARESLTLR